MKYIYCILKIIKLNIEILNIYKNLLSLFIVYNFIIYGRKIFFNLGREYISSDLLNK